MYIFFFSFLLILILSFFIFNFHNFYKFKIIKNEKDTNINPDDFLNLTDNEIINDIQKNLNEYYYPLKFNYTIKKFKSLLMNYNTQEDLSYKKNPILSIIIPIYNGEKNILNGLLSIGTQKLKNIEIIYIDDHSIDNSINLIKEVQKIDKRIVLYENKINKGILYTRCFGINKAKGKYIISMDQDDLYINKYLFNILLNIAEEKKLDILNFEYVILNNKKFYFQKRFKKPNYNKIINNKELSNIKNILSRKDYSFFTWDKLIKRNIYLSALKLIENEYLNMYMNQEEDVCITSCLLKIAKNFMKIKLFGYCYIESEFQWSVVLKFNRLNQTKIDKYVNSFFESEKLLYKITKNSKKEKLYVIQRLLDVLKYNKFVKKVNNDYTKNLVLEVCSIFIKSKFTINKNRKKIQRFVQQFKKINKIK